MVEFAANEHVSEGVTSEAWPLSTITFAPCISVSIVMCTPACSKIQQSFILGFLILVFIRHVFNLLHYYYTG